MKEPRPLSLRVQLTIWFGFSFGVILATILMLVVVVDAGRIFDGDWTHYDWLIRVELGAVFAAFVGGVAAAWLILGVALEPLRRITEAARDVAPERLDESRIDVPETGAEVNAARTALNSALDRIDQGYQAQERFISNVSHELKTPIAVLSSEAQRLRRQERSPEELNKFVAEVASQTGRLGKIVESFLTLARIDYEARLEKNEEYWFHDLLVEAVSRSRAQALTHDVHIELDLPQLDEAEHDDDDDPDDVFDEPSWGDPELVSSAVENLIRNAIRFTPRKSTVKVSLCAEEPTDEGARPRAVITVQDKGPGMPDDLIATVFEPFHQADSEREGKRGTGLGLAIAHKVTDLHRGEIRAFNRADGGPGCVLEIRLPFLSENDWAADRVITAESAKGDVGSGMRERAETD